MSRLLAGSLGALLVLAGCGAGTDAAPTAPEGPVPVRVAQPLPESGPVELRIGAIDATSSLVPLGLDADGTIEVPALDEPMQAGWYRYGPTPGELGPAVLLGHVNADGEDGTVARLGDTTDAQHHRRATAADHLRRGPGPAAAQLPRQHHRLRRTHPSAGTVSRSMTDRSNLVPAGASFGGDGGTRRL